MLSNPGSSFFKNSFLFYVTRITQVSLFLLADVIIARLLGPSGKGVVAMVWLIPSFLSILFDMGIHKANVYFLNAETSRSVIGNSTFLALVTGGLLAALMWIFRPRVAAWFSLSGYELEIGIGSLLVPSTMLFSYFTYILLAQKRFLERNLADLIFGCVFPFSAFSLIYIVRMGVLGGILSRVIAVSAGAFMGLWYVFKHTNSVLPSLDLPLLKRSLIYGIKSQFGVILQFFNYRVGIFFLNHFLQAGSVGIYTVAISIAEFLWLIPTSIGNVLFSTIKSENEQRSVDFTCLVCRQTILLVILASLLLVPVSRIIIPLFFGDQFVSAFKPLVVLLPGVILLSIHKVLIFALIGKGFPQYMSHAAAIALIFTLSLNPIFIPLMGIEGAALASSLAYAVCAFYTASRFKKFAGITWSAFLMPCRKDFELYHGYIRRLFAARSL